MLYSAPIMDADKPIAPRLHRHEKLALAVLLPLLLALAVVGMGRKEKDIYEKWLERAQAAHQALELFAEHHNERFPPDAMFYERPLGLVDYYVKWDPKWKIDYEVHENETGGEYVCLEFGGPMRERLYFGLCNNPEYRRRYGRGQPIPGHVNRIWVVREEAHILPLHDPTLAPFLGR